MAQAPVSVELADLPAQTAELIGKLLQRRGINISTSGRVPAPASAGGTHVLQKSASGRGEAQAVNEWPIALQWRRSFARPQGHAGQGDIAFVMGDEKHGTIRGRPILQRLAVGDESAGQISRNQRPEISPYDFLRRFF